jgi:hypothetical protein
MTVQLRTTARLATMLFALGACTAVAQAAPPLPDADKAGMLRALHEFLDPVFNLNPAMQLDPALRTEGQKLATAHLAGVDGMFRTWIDEEYTRVVSGGGKVSLRRVFDVVMARLQNELALWQIEPGDADYERATLDVLRTAAPPRVCSIAVDNRYRDFSQRIMRIQAMPDARRQVALAGERALLGHWGQRRAALPDWPDPLPRDAAMAWLRPPQASPAPAGSRRPGLALPPMLASDLLGMRRDYADLNEAEQCMLQQWWLQENLRQGALPAAALSAFRYGTAVFPTVRYAGMPEVVGPAITYDPAVPAPPYPKIASRFGVTGTTRTRVRLDAAGKPLQAAVEKRDVKVDGIRGVRAVAFENVFDNIVLQYAMARTYAKPKDDKPFRFEYVWQLSDEPAAPGGDAAAQPGGNKR